MKSEKFMLVAIILLLHFWIKFTVSEPYPGLVLPSFSSNGGNENFYKISKISFTFFNTNNDSLTVLPETVFREFPPRLSGHYTGHIWNRKINGPSLSDNDEKKLKNYLFQRGTTLWDAKKTIVRIALRRDQYTFIKDDPITLVEKITTEEWLINQYEEKR